MEEGFRGVEPRPLPLGPAGRLSPLFLAAEKPPATPDFLGDELETAAGQAVRGADDLPWRVGCLEFALEPGAVVVVAVESFASAFVRPVAAIEIAMSVDESVQIIERQVEPLGDFFAGNPKEAYSAASSMRAASSGVGEAAQISIPNTSRILRQRTARMERNGATRKTMHTLKPVSKRRKTQIDAHALTVVQAAQNAIPHTAPVTFSAASAHTGLGPRWAGQTEQLDTESFYGV